MNTILMAAGLMAVVAISMTVKNMKTPPGLGVRSGKLAAVPKSPNAVSSQADDPGKRVDPFPFKKRDMDLTKKSIKQAMFSHGNISIKTETEDYIHAVSTTRRMRYHDDLEFYFDERGGVVHFRSASRIGYSDLGMNQQRYHALMELYFRIT